jgi:uncharacterized protein (DUF952 family)
VRIYHVTTRAVWDEAVRAGVYEMSTRDVSLAEQGFIHCSLVHQLSDVVDRLYGDVGDLVVLAVDPDRLDVPVRYEAVPDAAQEYPHVYGPLPLAAVVEVRAVTRAPDGRLAWPEPSADAG